MRSRFVAFAATIVLAVSGLVAASEASPRAPRDGFVRRAGHVLLLDGRPFRFAGANNYYLMYKSRHMVDDVLTTAAANDLTVVRAWGWLDIGNLDGSNAVAGKADGVYFQYWNGSRPAYNDGPDGLERLDYVIYRAGQLGLKLVIPFTNNWRDFGGMDQYVRWRGGRYHDEFYTDPLIRQWYQDWIAHVTDRVNAYTGVKYKDDPTIMLWELANEPRCKGSGVYPQSPGCTTRTITRWAADMSAFVKQVAPRQLVAIGDEGFYCASGATDWTENCGEGVDTLALTRLPHVDVMSFHLYPDHWGKDAAWGTQWIERHIRDGRALGKPVLLGEYGWHDPATRNVVYKTWSDALLAGGGQRGADGALVWMLAGQQDNGAPYPDYDGFTVYAGTPVYRALGNFAQMMTAGRALTFPPVADDDRVHTAFDTPVTLTPAANDIAYGSATIDARALDLDPQANGRQTSHKVYGGAFEASPDGTVRFTPDVGFSGTATASYTVRDTRGRTSNPATLAVTVLPDPRGALPLASFEMDTEGWAAAAWQSNAGVVERSDAYASDGSHSLKILTAEGGWFGVTPPTPFDLSGKTRLRLAIKTTHAGTSHNVALQLGEGWTWCESGWSWIDPDTTTTIDVDLLQLGCESLDRSQVRAIYVWFSGDGTFYLDHVRAE